MPMRMAGTPSRRLVDDLHLLSIHSTTVSRESRDSSFDLAKIGRRQLNIDRSQVLVRLPPMDGVVHDVRHALASRVAGGDISVQAVARTLATSVRSLQRRLAARSRVPTRLLGSGRLQTGPSGDGISKRRRHSARDTDREQLTLNVRRERAPTVV
jgi:hypothetical protein